MPVSWVREKVKIEKGPYAGVEGGGPEYETLAMLGVIVWSMISKRYASLTSSVIDLVSIPCQPAKSLLLAWRPMRKV